MAECHKIKALFLEDNPDDVELELYELQKGGFEITYEIARNREEFLEKLPNTEADIIIADYSLPDITGIEALHLCKEGKIDVPFILITGVGNEQIAVDSLREGATDYILKKNISHLAVRVARAFDINADHNAIKKAKLEKEGLQKQLFQAQKMESIGLFAGGIAHDFNNLLTGIIGYAGLTLDTLPSDSPAAKHLAKIIEISENASSLVKQLLLFSKNTPLELKTLDLNTLLKENVDFIRRVVEKTVDIHLNLQENLPAIQSDESQLSQVLMNLAVNARDAMQGRGDLEFKTERLSRSDIMERKLSLGMYEAEYICLSVSDTGCGIKEKDKEKIFDPFFTTKEAGKGTGLGLAIIYSIINKHHGWIDVDSRVGEGTTFKVYLPVFSGKKPTTEIPLGRKDSLSAPSRPVPADKTILVVEDEEIIQSFTITMLEGIGYHVLTAKDGEEALAIYKSNGAKIDLVLSDMIMPKKSGLELFTDLKVINPAIKFILVTGHCLENVEGGILRKMEAILLKPFATQKLVELINKALIE